MCDRATAMLRAASADTSQPRARRQRRASPAGAAHHDLAKRHFVLLARSVPIGSADPPIHAPAAASRAIFTKQVLQCRPLIWCHRADREVHAAFLSGYLRHAHDQYITRGWCDIPRTFGTSRSMERFLASFAADRPAANFSITPAQLPGVFERAAGERRRGPRTRAAAAAQGSSRSASSWR